jgi:hypothetical protein
MHFFSPSYKLAQSGMCSLLIFDYHIWNKCYFDVYKLVSDVYYIIRYRGISGWTFDKLHKIAIGILLKSQHWMLLYTVLLSCTYGIYNCENCLKYTLIKKLNWSLAEQFSGEVKSFIYVLVCDHLIKTIQHW